MNNSRVLSLLQPIGNMTMPRPPTMTPLESQLFDLTMIARRAADGLGSPGPTLRRGFVSPELVGARCQYWSFSTTEVLS